MKNIETHKQEIFNVSDFQSKGILDTRIPEIIVESIQNSLNKLNEYPSTTSIVSEEDLSVSFGIMEKNETGNHILKYKVKILHLS